jgi:hypothetical protein
MTTFRSMRDIVRATAAVTGIPAANIVSSEVAKSSNGGHTNRLNTARMVAIRIAADRGFSVPVIGAAMNRDNATIRHRLRTPTVPISSIVEGVEARLALPTWRERTAGEVAKHGIAAPPPR